MVDVDSYASSSVSEWNALWQGRNAGKKSRVGDQGGVCAEADLSGLVFRYRELRFYEGMVVRFVRNKRPLKIIFA